MSRDLSKRFADGKPIDLEALKKIVEDDLRRDGMTPDPVVPPTSEGGRTDASFEDAAIKYEWDVKTANERRVFEAAQYAFDAQIQRGNPGGYRKNPDICYVCERIRSKCPTVYLEIRMERENRRGSIEVGIVADTWMMGYNKHGEFFVHQNLIDQCQRKLHEKEQGQGHSPAGFQL